MIELNPQQNPDHRTLTLSGGESDVIKKTFNAELIGIQTPADTKGVSSFTFQKAVAADGPWVTVTDAAGSDFTVTVANSKGYYFDPSVFAGARYLKLIPSPAPSVPIDLQLEFKGLV